MEGENERVNERGTGKIRTAPVSLVFFFLYRGWGGVEDVDPSKAFRRKPTFHERKSRNIHMVGLFRFSPSSRMDVTRFLTFFLDSSLFSFRGDVHPILDPLDHWISSFSVRLESMHDGMVHSSSSYDSFFFLGTQMVESLVLVFLAMTWYLWRL